MAETRLPLETNEPGKLRLFHLAMAMMTIVIYWASWIYVLYLA